MAASGSKYTCSCTTQTIWTKTKENLLLVSTFFAIILGLCLGFGLREVDISTEVLDWIKIWGEIFLRLLNLIVLPLVPSCIIIGFSNLDSQSSGKLGIITIVWILVTTTIAVFCGVVFTLLIRPGASLGESEFQGYTLTEENYGDVFRDFLRNLFPENIVRTCIQYSMTVYEPIKAKNQTELSTDLQYQDGINILGILTVSILFGAGAQSIGAPARPFVNIAKAVYSITLTVMQLILWYSPLGILSLIVGSLIEVEDLYDALASMGLFILTVITSLSFHTFIVLPLCYFVLTRCNPFTVMIAFLDATIAVAGPPSDVVGIQLMLRDADEKLHYNKKISNFVIPSTICVNRNGSAQFICICAIFIAQSYAISLSAAQLFILGLLIVLLSGAIAAVPSSSIVTLLLVGDYLGIPVQGRVGLLLALEWLLDRCRTMVNLQGTAFGVALGDYYCSKDVDSSGEEKEEIVPMEEKDNVSQVSNGETNHASIEH